MKSNAAVACPGGGLLQSHLVLRIRRTWMLSIDNKLSSYSVVSDIAIAYIEFLVHLED